MKIINSVSGQGGEIKGTLPVQFGSGDSRYTIPGVIGEGVTLTVTGDGTDAVKLKSSAYLVYSEITKDYIKMVALRSLPMTVPSGSTAIMPMRLERLRMA